MFGGLVVLCLLFSALPLSRVAGHPWPGFFYSPFYTNNIFSDETAPAYQAGLRPEDRVVQAGALPGQWPRISALAKQTALAAQLNRPLTLLYELGREATTIPVTVEELSWLRVLEKSGPFFLAALLLVLLALSGKPMALEKRLLTLVASLALFAAPDYFLNPGSGLNSGFVPFGSFAPDDWLLKSAKWSGYLYAPLWKFTLGIGAIFFLRLKKSPESRVQSPESKKFYSSLFTLHASSFIVALLVFDLVSYVSEAVRTATYNNPDYVVWHGRSAFWPEWIVFGLALLTAGFRKGRITPQNWLGLFGLVLFLVGFMIPTTFDIPLPGLGPQWYVFGLIAFILTVGDLQGVQSSKSK